MAGVAAACEQPRAIAPGPIALTGKDAAFGLRLTAPLEAPGPYYELCMRVERAGDPHPAWTAQLVAGRRVDLRAVLRSSSGATDTLDDAVPDPTDSTRVCLGEGATGIGRSSQGNPSEPTYDRIELSSDSSMTLTDITWWSGMRRAPF